MIQLNSADPKTANPCMFSGGGANLFIALTWQMFPENYKLTGESTNRAKITTVERALKCTQSAGMTAVWAKTRIVVWGRRCSRADEPGSDCWLGPGQSGSGF
jgi:hypothetical protein